MTRWGIPIDLIEGPARIWSVMEFDEFYTAADLIEKAQISSSSCSRHLETLYKRGVIQRLSGCSTRGRPAYFYSLKKGDPS